MQTLESRHAAWRAGMQKQASWYEYHPSTPSGLERQGRTGGYSYQRDCFKSRHIFSGAPTCNFTVNVMISCPDCAALPGVPLPLSFWLSLCRTCSLRRAAVRAHVPTCARCGLVGEELEQYSNKSTAYPTPIISDNLTRRPYHHIIRLSKY